MNKISESGHSKNVANWEQLTTTVLSFGSAYNPSRKEIQIPMVQQVGADARQAMNAMNVTKAEYKNASAARADAFEPVGPLVTRCMDAMKSTATIYRVDDNAKTIARKIRGSRAKTKKAVDPTALTTDGKLEKEISTSQMSYDNQLANFDELISYFESVPEYAPNEPELKTANLRVFWNDLKTKNDRAIAATINFGHARAKRNEILYTPITGMVDLSVDVKTYVRSVYGIKSPEYKSLTKLSFRSIPKSTALSSDFPITSSGSQVLT